MKKQDVRAENLDILRFRYLEGDASASRGLRQVQSQYGTKGLGRLLRSHLVESVGPREIKKRDEIDDLLAFYALLEVAIVCGYVPAALPPAFKRETLRILSEPSVERFYRRLYPLLLVQLFAARLAGRFAVPVQAEGAATRTFIQFLDISELLKTEEVETFLWMLDDGARDGENFDDLIEVVQSPKELVKALTTPPEERSASDEAAHGFRGFTAFCRQLDRLLGETAAAPLLQSALWHYHGYWLQLLSGSVLGVMSAVIEQQRSWVTLDPVGKDAARRVKETHASMDTTELVLQRLTSGIYRAPLESFFFEHALAKEAAIASRRSPSKVRGPQKSALFLAEAPSDNVISLPPALTSREAEVLRLLAGGRTTKAIADSMKLSPLTVRTYIDRLYVKLDVRNRRELVTSARRVCRIYPDWALRNFKSSVPAKSITPLQTG